MVNKHIYVFMIFFFSFNSYASEIVYNKNNILITKQDVHQYKLIKKEINYSNDNIIIKDIVLIKRTIDTLKNKNPKYYEQVMSQITSRNLYVDKVDQNFLNEYFFYINVKNDIAREFMLNKFEKNQIKIIFKNKNITFGLSQNECLTIFKTIPIDDLNTDEIYKILNREIVNFQFKKKFENSLLDVCLSEKITNEIIQLFNGYMLSNSKEDFLKFIYEKK